MNPLAKKALDKLEGKQFTYMGVVHEVRSGVPVVLQPAIVKQPLYVRWMTLNDVMRVYGHPRPLLLRLARDRVIRSVKQGTGRGAIPAYFLCVEDIEAWNKSDRARWAENKRTRSRKAQPLDIVSNSIDAIIAHAKLRHARSARKTVKHARAVKRDILS